MSDMRASLEWCMIRGNWDNYKNNITVIFMVDPWLIPIVFAEHARSRGAKVYIILIISTSIYT
jgi:hypothetical protein